MPKKTDQKTLDIVRDLASQGMSSTQIGLRINKSPKAIQSLFRTYSIPCISQGAQRGNRSANAVPFDESLAESLYQDGLTYGEIAAALHVVGASPDEIVRRRLIRRLGVQSRIGKASGIRNYFWKGGVADRNENCRNRYECYQIVVAFLGMLLPEGWIVHHLNERPDDNNLSNLCLFPSATAHSSHHQWLLKNRVEGDSMEAILQALKNGGHLLQPLPDRKAASPDKDLLLLLEMAAQQLGYRQKWKHLIDREYQPRVRRVS